MIDSSGWLEYFISGKNASFFAPAIQDIANVVVPTISGEFGVSDWVMLFIFAASVWVYKSRVGASMNVHNALKSQRI